MRILVIGTGSIGKKHVNLLKKHFDHEVAAVNRVMDWHEVEEWKPDCVIIANATCAHVETAMECAKRNIPFMLEKPLSHNMDRVSELISEIQRRNAVSFVAYPLRFHPVITTLKERMPGKVEFAKLVCRSNGREWPKIRRTRAEGGGALLELSHEMDLAQCLFGEITEIKGTTARKSDLLEDCEDYAHLTLIHASGQETQVELSLAHAFTERFLLVDDPNFTVKRGYSACDEMYVNQLRYFLDNIHNPGMQNNLEEAAGLFKEIMMFRDTT